MLFLTGINPFERSSNGQDCNTDERASSRLALRNWITLQTVHEKVHNGTFYVRCIFRSVNFWFTVSSYAILLHNPQSSCMRDLRPFNCWDFHCFWTFSIECYTREHGFKAPWYPSGGSGSNFNGQIYTGHWQLRVKLRILRVQLEYNCRSLFLDMKEHWLQIS